MKNKHLPILALLFASTTSGAAPWVTPVDCSSVANDPVAELACNLAQHSLDQLSETGKIDGRIAEIGFNPISASFFKKKFSFRTCPAFDCLLSPWATFDSTLEIKGTIQSAGEQIAGALYIQFEHQLEISGTSDARGITVTDLSSLQNFDRGGTLRSLLLKKAWLLNVFWIADGERCDTYREDEGDPYCASGEVSLLRLLRTTQGLSWTKVGCADGFHPYQKPTDWAVAQGTSHYRGNAAMELPELATLARLSLPDGGKPAFRALWKSYLADLARSEKFERLRRCKCTFE